MPSYKTGFCRTGHHKGPTGSNKPTMMRHKGRGRATMLFLPKLPGASPNGIFLLRAYFKGERLEGGGILYRHLRIGKVSTPMSNRGASGGANTGG